VAAAVAAEGGQPRALCRSEPPPGAAVEEWIAGDIRDPETVARAVAGCEAVVHVAALYSYWRADAPAMGEVNVGGTRNVLEAATRAGVRRVLVTSSSATCGPVPGRPATEADRPPEWELSIPYKRTKLAAERLALAAARQGQDVLCVNPTTVIGPGDAQPTPSGKMIRDLVEGRIHGYLRRAGLNVVSVADVARGHVMALERGRAGERYILGGEDVWLRDAFAIATGAVNGSPPRIGLPWAAVYGAAVLADLAGRLRGREPTLLVRNEVRLARLPLFFSSAKARQELGYSPGPAVAAISSAARWFAQRAGAAPPGPLSYRAARGLTA
jgi:dihydroflavonol-4-reductase